MPLPVNPCPGHCRCARSWVRAITIGGGRGWTTSAARRPSRRELLWITGTTRHTIHNPTGPAPRGKWSRASSCRQGHSTHTKSPQGPARRMHADLLPPAWALCLARLRARTDAAAVRDMDTPSLLCGRGRNAEAASPPIASSCNGSATGSATASRRSRARQRADRSPSNSPSWTPSARLRSGTTRPWKARRLPRPPHRRPLWIARRGSPSPRRAGRPPSRRPPPGSWTRPASIRGSISRLSWPARPTSWPAPPACRWPTIPRRTTRCSCTAASAWARRTWSRRSATTSWRRTPQPRSATSTPRRTCPTWFAPTSTRPSTNSSGTTVRSTCC